MRKRPTALTVAALILIAGVVVGRERTAADMLQEAAAPALAAPRNDGIDLSSLQRDAASTPPRVDPFGRPAALEKKEIVQARPEAPPLPFAYFGRLTENGKTEVFVINGEEVHAVAPGKSIGDYRVDKVTEKAIAFTYLPMKAKQTLEIQ